MRNFLNHKTKYFNEFANLMVKKYKKLKFGIDSPKGLVDPYLISIRYDLANWQSSGDFSTLSELKILYKNMIPFKSTSCDDLYIVNVNNYVNSGGSATREYAVTTPTLVWTFQHDLGYNPNVTTVDQNNQEMSGAVTYSGNNTVTITFTSPVMGWAYLS